MGFRENLRVRYGVKNLLLIEIYLMANSPKMPRYGCRDKLRFVLVADLDNNKLFFHLNKIGWAASMLFSSKNEYVSDIKYSC